jgi:hypothetical protein
MTKIHSLLEPRATNCSVDTLKETGLSELAQLSAAISLKRIADLLCSDTLPPCFQSVNAYGENFAVAIQEGIVRGQRGISQYD